MVEVATRNAVRNDEWELSELIAHLSAELDETSDALALRSLRRDSTHHSVSVAFELNVYSRFDASARKVLFRSAQPGEEGASRLKLELAPLPSEQLQAQAQEVLRTRGAPTTPPPVT
ncbi:MAG TPA: hypothetical protein VF824_08370 [Thermoanaerobaculia bacterium]|jgi:hypothetical protein